MKVLALSIGTLGLAQATLWLWAPTVALWQTRTALERYRSSESLDAVMQIYRESMQYTFIEAGVVGALMILSSVLLLARKRAGWNLWLACLCLTLVGATTSIASGGLSVGLVMRLILLGALLFATIRAHRSKRKASWFGAEQTT
jgi:hypothetical protein